MDHQPIPALLWPVESIAWGNQPVVLAVPTVMGTPRERTRLQVRRVVREVLSRLLALAPEQVELQGRPGHPLRFAAPLQEMGLSFAHESGLSLVAIRPDGPVGVDLMHRHQVPDDWPVLARDYLGPYVAAQLGAFAPEDGKGAFAHFWVSLEARLKCLGFPLDEWRIETADRLTACTVAPVVLPAGWIGALAWL
jgi:4'-phosphopantetheinyl transferase